MCGAFSGRATSTAAVGVVHDSFISYSDGRRHRWSHNPFCVNRHDIFQNSTAEQRQFNETPSQRHVFCGKRHDPAVSASSRTRRQRCRQEEAARGRRGRQTQQRGLGAGALGDRAQLLAHEGRGQGAGRHCAGRRTQGGAATGSSCAEAESSSKPRVGEPAKQPRRPHKAGGAVREPRAPPPPEKD